MKVTINDKEITIKSGMKAMLLFERIQQESTNLIGGLNSLVQYFWCCVYSSPNGSDITYETFVDWLDDKQDILFEFSKWVNEQKDMVPKKN